MAATYTGELEPVAEICVSIDKLAADNNLVRLQCTMVPRVEGFWMSFLHLELKWAFWLP